MHRSLLVLCLLAAPAWGAVSHDADSTLLDTSGSTTGDVSITLSAGSDSAIYCGAATEGASPDISGVQLDPGGGDQADFTMVPASDVVNGTHEGSLWYLMDANMPASGTYTIRLTLTASGALNLSCSAFHGVSQTVSTNKAENTGTGSGARTVGSITTTANGDYVYTLFAQDCNTCGGSWSSATGADTNTIVGNGTNGSLAMATTRVLDNVAGAVNAGISFSTSDDWLATAVEVTEASSGSTTTWTDTTVDIGTDFQGTVSSGLTSAATKCVFASGDELAVTSNGTTTSGDCAHDKSDYLSGGDMSNTRVGVATTAYLGNATETTTAGPVTINSPDNGTTEHFGTAANASPDADSLYLNSDFTTEYASFDSDEDDVWVTVNGGACDFDPAEGIFECTVLPASGYVRVYDVSATDWLTESSWSIDSPDGSCGHAISLTPTVRPIAYSPVKPVSC